MLNCGKKRNRNKSDISKIEKMAEAIDDGGNNSKSNSNNVVVDVAAAATAGAVVVTTTSSSGNNSNSNGVTTDVTVNHQPNNSCRNNTNATNQTNSGSGGGGGTRRTHQRFSCSRCCNDLFNYLRRLRVSPEELEQRYKSREIDKFLEKDKHTFRRQVRLLLLGAGESGKSTFLKQMRIIHGVKFEPELLREYQHVIYQNIVRGMQVLVDAREKLDIAWDQPSTELAAEEARKFLHGTDLDTESFQQYAPTLHILWQDRAIRKAYDRRREFQISDSVNYFFDEIDRIAKSNYAPSQKDILHCRKATKGVYEFTIKIKDIPFVFVDVGGQRTQRQKWTKCFSSVTSILFLVSTSEFDQVLAEDRKTNRLEESKNIFDTIVNNTTFNGISTILFLNKTDLLAIKVRNPETDIRWYYPQFTGNPHSILDVQNFILQMFMNTRRNTHAAIYHHFTNAVDTQNIQIVFNSVKDTILQRNLSALMLQ